MTEKRRQALKKRNANVRPVCDVPAAIRIMVASVSHKEIVE